ncbi:MAG: hypothetical protein GWP39_00810 [Planctomycetia bacterium]|nr:hypothetical protein [Planctomycetia bacterium]
MVRSNRVSPFNMGHIASLVMICLIISMFMTPRINGQGVTYHVDSSASGNSGLSWGDAFGDLQQALLVALPGDEIFVAGGLYAADQGGGQVSGNTTSQFVIPGGVSILGGFAGSSYPVPGIRDLALYDSILDGRVQAIYVSSTEGVDAPFCGLSTELPCATIQEGIERAIETGLEIIRVQSGNYSGTVILRDGLIIQGGYDSNWEWAESGTPGHETIFLGGIDEFGQAVTVSAQGLSLGTEIADVEIQGIHATGSVNGVARSSYALHVQDSNLKLHRVSIFCGDGAPGSSGIAGTDLSSNPAASGQGGGNSDSYFSFCDATAVGAGGLAGGGGPTGGGNGGAGGTMDFNCCSTIPNPFCDNYDATSGNSGSDGAGASGWGLGGSGGGTCSAGGDGAPGSEGSPGAGGSGGLSGGMVETNYWSVESGNPGSSGTPGGGGGGGGGSGGCDDGTDSYGAGGGGGGSGGIPSPNPGEGGGGGGSSFGLFILGSSDVQLFGGTIILGTGGNGGTGGSPGRGQTGGLGGSGGNGSSGSPGGGQGGDGGNGGDSGGGGGGGGGDSFAAWTDGVAVTGFNTLVTSGSGGSGGAGGSLPGLPAGLSGIGGESGLVFNGLTEITTDEIPARPLDRSARLLQFTGDNIFLEGLKVVGSSSAGLETPVQFPGTGHLIRNCHFENLISQATGTVSVSGFVTFEGCRFQNCQANESAAVTLLENGICRLENCVLTGNQSLIGASTVGVLDQGLLIIVNSTIFGNQNLISGDVIQASGTSQIFLQNNVIYGNSTSSTVLAIPPTSVALRNIIQGGFAGDNFDVDPQFSDSVLGDFTPTAGSPCVDMAISASSTTQVDFAGLPREVCNGVDIGALERQSCGDGANVDFLRGDVNADGDRNLADAVSLLEFLFLSGALPCVAATDVNDDGDINVADPSQLLSFLFTGASAPPEPTLVCGQDPDGSITACEDYSNCP